MSWSDDTRCLYCDGKLPLYRKLTQGQFCSKAHQTAYWEDQEKLAVERLHQTHDALKAYRAAEPVESILGPAVTVPGFDESSEPEILFGPEEEPVQYAVPAAAGGGLSAINLYGPLGESVWPAPGEPLRVLAADPFEYEMVVGVSRPSREVRGTTILGRIPAGRPLRTWSGVFITPRMGGLAFLAAAAEAAIEATSQAALEAAIETIKPAIQGRLVLDARADYAPALAGRTGFVLHPARIVSAPRGIFGLFDVQIAPVTGLVLTVAPQSDLLEKLLFDQLQMAGTLPCLTVFGRTGGRLLVAGDASLSVAMEPAANAMDARLPEFRLAGHLVMANLSPASAGARNLPLPAARKAATTPVFEPAAALEAAGSRPRLPSIRVAPTAIPETNWEPPAAGLHRLAVAVSAAAGKTAFAQVEAAPGTAPPAEPSVPARRVTPVALEPRTKAEGLAQLPYAGRIRPAAAKAKPQPVNAAISHGPHYEPILPESRLEPLADKPIADLFRRHHAKRGFPTFSSPSALLGEAVAFWRNAPRDLKLLVFAIPVLLALVFQPSLPKVSVATPEMATGFSGEFRQVLNTQLANLRQTVVNRAAIALDEDFRHGLDQWISVGGATTKWSFDATGFVQPGPLSLYGPSMGLTDYQMQFLGMIDRGALSWVVRAKDFENYQVVRLVVAKPGPIPTIVLQRYAVIGGVAQDRVDTPVPISTREQMQYRVGLNIEGDDMSVTVQGQIVDSWTEPRLKRGGIGFFTLRGEQSRVRWVQITHQYDALGRLCAYLVPYEFSNTTGSW